MPVLDRIAYFHNRRDEVPNQELAKDLARNQDRQGILEIVENLSNKNQNIQSDCLKVLYEIGYLEPELIADYVQDFLNLLRHKNNRMIWGSMIALGSIAVLKPKDIWNHRQLVIDTMNRGTLITVVWGVKTLARVGATDEAYCRQLFPILLQYLKTCIPRDMPMHAESILGMIDRNNREAFLAVLEARQKEMTPAQLSRLRKTINQI
jgi:hypothetical protein